MPRGAKPARPAVGQHSAGASADGQHAPASGFNPDAREFVPGTPAQQPPATQTGGRQTDAQRSLESHGSTKAKGRGGLSQALKTSGRATDGGTQRRTPPTQDPPSRDADVALLGRSPSRAFVPANHLLNFHYERPPERGGLPHASRPRGRRPPVRARPQDRTHFLQATCRLLVSGAADIRAAAADADCTPIWADVAQVEMLVPAVPQCPISLERPPPAAHVTPCGHVFSLPALVGHLLHVGGGGLRRAAPCPLCAAPVAARELRPARFCVVTPPQVGERLTFTLVKRARHGALVTEAFPGSEPAHFARIRRVADASEVWAGVAQELASYTAQVECAGGPDAAQELPIAQAAVEVLAEQARAFAERQQRLAGVAAGTADAEAAEAAAGEVAARAVRQVAGMGWQRAAEAQRAEAAVAARLSAFPALPTAAAAGRAGLPPAHEPAFSDEEGVPPPAAAHGSRASPPQQAPNTKAESSPPEAAAASHVLAPAAAAGAAAGGPSADFFLYQAADGQPIFLHPLQLRMLLAAAGGYEALPVCVEGDVVELESAVQTEQLRRRHRALAHLPLGGTFTLAEVELPGLPVEVTDAFARELGARAQRRAAAAHAARLEAARERAREAAEARAAVRPSAAELRAMPLPGRPATQTPADLEAEVLSAAEGGAAPGPGTSPPPAPPQAGVSFAHMARLGFAASGPALPPPAGAGAPLPGGGRGCSPSASPPAGQPVWPGRSAAARPADAVAQARQPALPTPPDPGRPGQGRRKAGKPLVVLGMQNRRY